MNGVQNPYSDALKDISYEIVAGVESHIQINSLSKAFCSCESGYGGLPNSRVCPVCLGLPGALPRVNKKLCEVAVLMGTAFHSVISDKLFFVRKHYTYPDLPKGYQITQKPAFCSGGYLDIMVKGLRKRVDLVGLHIEEDTGKIFYPDDQNTAYVDYNRAGASLIEITSQPCLSSPDEVSAYAQALRELVRYLGVSNGDMEEGSLRCDVNVNLKIYNDGEVFKTSVVEIKNLNSFRSLRRAVEYEVHQQLMEWVIEKRNVLSGSNSDLNKEILKDYWETKGWDEKQGKTYFLRSKGMENDYRCFIDPDVPCFFVPQQWVEDIAKDVGELPLNIRLRLEKRYSLSEFDCTMITQSSDFLEFYEKAALYTKSYKKLANWLLSELISVLKLNRVDVKNSPVSPEALAELVNYIEDGSISGKQAKDIFYHMNKTSKMPRDLIQSQQVSQIVDKDTLRGIVLEVLQENQNAILDYTRGKTHSLKFLMGRVMKKSSGRVNPELASKVLKEELVKQESFGA